MVCMKSLSPTLLVYIVYFNFIFYLVPAGIFSLAQTPRPWLRPRLVGFRARMEGRELLAMSGSSRLVMSETM